MAQAAGRLVVVVIWDGFRPDWVSPEVTPELWRRAHEGVWFAASHCAYPSETRVNSTALSTGCYAGRAGITGNSLYVPGFDAEQPARVVNTGDHTQLARLAAVDAPLVRVPSVADALAAAGGATVVASAGSPGSALLLNPRPDGITLNYALLRPQWLVERVYRDLSAPPADSRPATRRSDWVTRGLLEVLLPEVVAPVVREGRPAVAYWWLTDPDHTAHHEGLGVAATVQSLRENDARLAALHARLETLGLAAQTDVLLTSDHGFSTAGPPRGYDRALVEAGLRDGPDTDDVVTTGQGGGGIWLHDRARHRAVDTVRWLQAQPWVGAILARDGGPADGLPGTLPLSVVWNGRLEGTGVRAPDIKFSVGWSHQANEAGIKGTVLAGGGRGASHGSASPYDMRNSLFAWGPRFKQRLRSEVAAGIVDLAPTMRHLLGLPAVDCDGRLLEEALAGGPDPGQVAVERQTLEASAPLAGGGTYQQRVRLVRVGHTTYLESGTAERS